MLAESVNSLYDIPTTYHVHLRQEAKPIIWLCKVLTLARLRAPQRSCEPLSRWRMGDNADKTATNT